MRPVDRLARLEWWAVALATVVFYAWSDASWWLFAVLILAPDLSALGYLAGPRIGAISYNSLHVLIGPAALLIAAPFVDLPLLEPVALIWLAHIAIDRALGYGLKLSTSFQDTHLGRIGREKPAAS